MKTELKPEVAKLIIRLAISLREVTSILLDSKDARVQDLSDLIEDTLKLSGLQEGDDLTAIGSETR